MSRVQATSDFIDHKMLNFHTQLPAVVTKVNGKSINCKAVVTTLYSDGSTTPYPEFLDVPILCLSANGGKTAIKMPIKVGDVVLVFFSERELGDFSSNSKGNNKSYSLKSHGLYPIGAMACILTESFGEDVYPNNLIIQNETSTIVIEPSGKITTTTSSTWEVNASKAIFKCPVMIEGHLESLGGTTNEGGITDDGKNIGSTHAHRGVKGGPDTSGGPV